jgi:alanine racemase
VISRTALAAHAKRAVGAGGRIADLRRDAYGHGLLPVARAVLLAGADAVRVDDADQVRMLRAEGLSASTTAEPDVDPVVLYGLPGPSADADRPAMRLTGRVMSVKPLRRGEAVSYGYTHRAERDTAVALITGGYAQAVVRALGNRAHVELHGRAHPIVGRVAMDVCVIDLEDPEASAVEGDTVTYFGGAGPAKTFLAEWATATGLTPAELACAAGLHATRAEED